MDKYTVQTCLLCVLSEANDLAYWLVNDLAYWLVNDLAYWLVNGRAYWLVNDRAYWPCRLARSQHTVSLSGTMKSGKSFGSVGV